MMLNQNKSLVHIEELLNVFNDIDHSIRELHQNSSHVFLQLNDFLKDYYKKNAIVLSNANQIFDTIGGNQETCLTCELNEIFNELEKYRIGTDNELAVNMSIYVQLNNKINNLSLLVRNFKQDLTTLKFLITNYKLIYNKGKFDAVLESLESWEKTMIYVSPWLTEIGKQINSLSFSLGNLYDNTRSSSENSLDEKFSFYEDLRSAIVLVNKKNLESKNYFPILKDKIKSTSGSIGNIITNLQYHDIIRQKVEHIQKSHFKIIASLNDDIGTTDKKLILDDDNKFSLIADIAGLQAAQLILITKEYQKALEVISDNFQIIAGDLTTISTISHEFSFDDNNSNTTLINLVKERLDKSLLMLDEYNSNSFNDGVLTVKKQVADLYLNINQEIFKPLEKVEYSPGFQDRASRDEPVDDDRPSIVMQIDSLTGDIIIKKNDLQNELKNVLKLSESFLAESDLNGFRSKLEKEQIRIMVNISKTLDRLDDESKQLDSVLLQNCNINKDIIKRLKATLNQADYYELFEKVLNVIIEQLNAINNRLRVEGKNDKSDKVRNLKEIETFYTVESERIIHQKVINDDIEINLTDNLANEDDLELF